MRRTLANVNMQQCDTCHERAFDLAIWCQSNECSWCDTDKCENGKQWSNANNINPCGLWFTLYYPLPYLATAIQPPCLKELTDIKEMLIAWIKPIMHVHYTIGHQLCYKDHIVNLPLTHDIRHVMQVHVIMYKTMKISIGLNPPLMMNLPWKNLFSTHLLHELKKQLWSLLDQMTMPALLGFLKTFEVETTVHQHILHCLCTKPSQDIFPHCWHHSPLCPMWKLQTWTASGKKSICLKMALKPLKQLLSIPRALKLFKPIFFCFLF